MTDIFLLWRIDRDRLLADALLGVYADLDAAKRGAIAYLSAMTTSGPPVRLIEWSAPGDHDVVRGPHPYLYGRQDFVIEPRTVRYGGIDNHFYRRHAEL